MVRNNTESNQITLMLLKVLYSIFLLFTSPVIAVSADTCASFQADGFSDVGFSKKYLTIGLDNGAGSIADQLYTYTRQIVIANEVSQSNSYNIGFNITVPNDGTTHYGSLYPGSSEVALNNFAITYSAMVVPTVTGDYKFSVDDVNQGAAIYVYDNRDMYCCEDMNIVKWLNGTSHFYYIPEDPNYQTNSMTLHLQKGLGYMILFTYMIHSGNAIFKPSMTTPSGEVITDFRSEMYSSYESFVCNVGSSKSYIISQWTGTFPTTYSTSVSTSLGIGEAGLPYTDAITIYYVMTPSPTSSSEAIASSSEAIASSSETIASSSETITSSFEAIASSSETIASSSETIASSSETIASSSETIAPSSLSEHSSVTSSVSFSTSETYSSRELSSESSVLSLNESFVVSSIVSSISIMSLYITSSTDGSSVSRIATSSKPESSTRSLLSNLDEISLNRKSTKFGSSKIASSTINNSNLVTSKTNSFANSSINRSSKKSIRNATISINNDDISTSTYTDIYEMTRTTTAKCSSQSTNINSTELYYSQSSTTVIVKTTTNENGEESVSAITHIIEASQATDINGTDKINEHIVVLSDNQLSSASAHLQSSKWNSTQSTFTSINIQHASNIAVEYTAGLLFSVISLTFQVFFI